jgi:glycosyltransferase involved in cell wall biosynthesis
MPVHNRETFLRESIDSVINQSFDDFEFIIISQDPTAKIREILDNYQLKDDRIRVHFQREHGLAEARNIGCKLSQGKYIAWMDSDDISLPERLEKQFKFMEAHPDVGICGSWVKVIGGLSDHCVWKYPSSDQRIRCELFFNSAFANSSIIMQRMLVSSMDSPFDTSYRLAEDYDLWLRASLITNFSNIEEVLVLYRIHSEAVTQRNQGHVQKMAYRVRLIQLNRLGIDPSEYEAELHNAIASWMFQTDQNFVEQVESWLCKIKSANTLKSIYPEPTFSQVLAEKWFCVCMHASGLGLWAWRAFWKSSLVEDSEISLRQRIKFALACGISYSHDPRRILSG